MVLSPECTDKDVLNLEVVRVEVVPEVPLADLSLRRGPGEEGALSGANVVPPCAVRGAGLVDLIPSSICNMCLCFVRNCFFLSDQL